MTLDELGVLLESRIAKCPQFYERARVFITRNILCCFFKHAIRHLNQDEGMITRHYDEFWWDRHFTPALRERILGDKLVTFFDKGDVLFFQGISGSTGCYQVIFLRVIQLYTTGEGHLVFMRSDNDDANYELKQTTTVPSGHAPTRSCALIEGGSGIVVFDYCWNPRYFIRHMATTYRFTAVTPGPHEELVRDAVKNLEFLLEDE
ncbi:hypothetical protein DFJ73DRAFT_86527 [Zopfochytrium polystomum]|nr:hypothetical protein DFJ73DRAFT_86527 [Zopfochytrium polystomum]